MQTHRDHRHAHAFTLIELLIVVAILAILAAVAIPNLLEAQTRAKIARARADLRTLAVGLESYRVDANGYPRPQGFPAQLAAITVDLFDQARTPLAVTTPIAYLNALPTDGFATQDPWSPLYHYLLKYETPGGGLNISVGRANAEFHLLSLGPDRRYDLTPIAFSDRPDVIAAIAMTLYDPTNGTISHGDLLYYGPGSGFRN